MSKSIFSFDDIQRILPHRYPFLLIDRVVELHKSASKTDRRGQRIVAIKNVTINEPFFQGHFPHQPVMPGVMVVETMAQAGALCVHRVEDKYEDMALCSVNRAKFRAPIVPGDQMEVHVMCTKDRNPILSFQGQVLVNSKVVAEAEFLAKAFFRK